MRGKGGAVSGKDKGLGRLVEAKCEWVAKNPFLFSRECRFCTTRHCRLWTPGRQGRVLGYHRPSWAPGWVAWLEVWAPKGNIQVLRKLIILTKAGLPRVKPYFPFNLGDISLCANETPRKRDISLYLSFHKFSKHLP